MATAYPAARNLCAAVTFKRGVFSYRFAFSPPQGGLCTDPLWVGESNVCCFQSLARRYRYSIWPLKFEFECFPTQNVCFPTQNLAVGTS